MISQYITLFGYYDILNPIPTITIAINNDIVIVISNGLRSEWRISPRANNHIKPITIIAMIPTIIKNHLLLICLEVIKLPQIYMCFFEENTCKIR